MGWIVRIKGDKHHYDVKDKDCIGRPCLRVHPVQTLAPVASGYRSTGHTRYVCAERDYNGCPQPNPPFDKALAAQRRREGMSIKLER